jgi:hypothetical protein
MGNVIRIRVVGAATVAVIAVLCCPTVPPAPSKARWFPRDSKPTCTLERIPGQHYELLFRFALTNTSPQPISIPYNDGYLPHGYAIIEIMSPRGDVVVNFTFDRFRESNGKETELVLPPGEAYSWKVDFASIGRGSDACKPGVDYTAVLRFPHSRGVASSPVVYFRFPVQREP